MNLVLEVSRFLESLLHNWSAKKCNVCKRGWLYVHTMHDALNQCV